VAPGQIETALGYPVHHSFPNDYPTVSSALNAGVPVALSNNSDMAVQFERFSRQIASPEGSEDVADGAKRKSALSFSFFSW
jgi:hypothetical protein